jgi:putative hydrolase of the HAD superfamily
MSENPDAVRLVVFDLGRVLVRICDDWQHACRLAGVRIQVASVLLHAGKLKQLSHELELGKIDFQQFASEAAPLLGASPQQVRCAFEGYTLAAFPGAAELVDEVRRAGIATACLTNTNEPHWRLLATPSHPSFFPLDRLDHRFASHLLRLRKPDDAIYAHVEAQTDMAPGSILFFDDVMENTAAAAHRGWRTHRVDPKLDNPIPRLREVLRSNGVLR